MDLAVGLLALVAVFSPGEGCGDVVRITPGQPFELSVGQKAAVDDRGMTLAFLSVPMDNRCPKGVQCITAGSARVRLEVRVADEAEQSELETEGGRGSPEWNVLGFEVELLGVEPYPSAKRPTAPSEYVARLAVRRS
jgi:hypothetical protein